MTPEKLTTTTLVLALVLSAGGCAQAPMPATPPTAIPVPPASSMPPVERAKAAGSAFSGALKSALAAKLAEDGTVGAIDFCHDEAPKIAERVSMEYGVRLGRVAVAGRQRSPANAPAAWQAEVLAAFERAAAAGTPVSALQRFQTEGLPAGIALRSMRGIPVEPVCLACHGKALAEDTRAALARHYPGDTATGFEAGDLRGALWVEVPASP